MLAQIPQRDAGGEGVLHEVVRRAEHEDLATMTDRKETGGAVERRANVVPIALFGLAGVQGHPHPQTAGQRPGLSGQRALRVEHGGQRVRSRRKRRVERIPHGLEDVAAVLGDGGAQEIVVPAEGGPHRLGMLLPQPGATLDIREEKGHRPRRQHGHGRPPQTLALLRLWGEFRCRRVMFPGGVPSRQRRLQPAQSFVESHRRS